jgi:hypothetical protein
VFLDLLVQVLDVLGSGDSWNELLEAALEVMNVGDGEEQEIFETLAEAEANIWGDDC